MKQTRTWQSIRFYAMSVAIFEGQSSYYDRLAQRNKDDTDVTTWLVGFLDTLVFSLRQVLADINQTQLTNEQDKVLNRLLDGDFSEGISNSQCGQGKPSDGQQAFSSASGNGVFGENCCRG